jgi:glycosyltransferase involved in cell wall biosynthesis
MILTLIPAYNEEETIANVVAEASEYVDEVVVIDDGSKDRTGTLAHDLGAVVLPHALNMGVGVAMRTGIDYAKQLKPRVVVTLDADGQHNPKDILRLIQPILAGQADLVLGSRFLLGNPQMPLIKLIGNKLLSTLTSLLARSRLTDAQTGFRALNTEALLAVHLEATHSHVQEMIIDLSRKGYRLKEVPISTSPRKRGNSKVTSNIVTYVMKTLPVIVRSYLRTRRGGHAG